MQPRRRRPPPPWERDRREPRHSLGNARRRWPRAYDGGEPTPAPRLNPRYRRAYDGDAASAERRAGGQPRGRRSTMDRIRRTPVRHGLLGLAIAGAATPVALQRYQRAMRTDPSHEQILSMSPASGINERAVAQAWAAARDDAAARADDPRENMIRDKMDRYQKMGLDRDLAESIYDIALEHDIDPDMAFGLVRTESEFKNYATSHVGALGLTQLMPRTADWLRPGVRESELRQPEVNLDIGFRYLRQLIDKYDGNQHLALLAYNRGPGTVDRVLKRGGDPDNGYADAVISGEGVHR